MNFECLLNIIFLRKQGVNETEVKVNKFYEDYVPSISGEKNVFFGRKSTNDAVHCGLQIESKKKNIMK